MDAVVCYDFEDSRVEDVPRPDPAADEVLIEIQRVQLSVTECNLYHGNEIAHYDKIVSRLEDGPAQMFGHEFCGIVVEAGPDVTELAVGDRVYAPGKISCGECRFCEQGYNVHCPNKEYIGYARPGALAEYVALPTEPLTKLPTDVTDAEGAAMQPLASSVLCVRDAQIQTGDVVAVFGTGVMGHQAGQLALQEGASTVYAIDVDPKKLEIARKNGLQPLDATETDPVAEIREATHGIGADVVIEAVGGDQSHGTAGDDPLAQAYRAVRSGGTLLQVGHIIGEVTIEPRRIRSKSIDWVHPTVGATTLTPNVHSGTHAAELVAQDRVSIDDYITHELDGLTSFEEAVDITLHKDEHGALGPAQIVL